MPFVFSFNPALFFLPPCVLVFSFNPRMVNERPLSFVLVSLLSYVTASPTPFFQIGCLLVLAACAFKCKNVCIDTHTRLLELITRFPLQFRGGRCCCSVHDAEDSAKPAIFRQAHPTFFSETVNKNIRPVMERVASLAGDARRQVRSPKYNAAALVPVPSSFRAYGYLHKGALLS